MATKPRRSTRSPSSGGRSERSGLRHRGHPDPLAERIGQRIRRFRQEAELTFGAFVEKTSLGRGYLSELERGLVVPTVGTLARVAKALELTIADLVLGDSERERLFDELRVVAVARVRELRERVRTSPSTKPRTR